MTESSKEERVHRVFENIYEKYDSMNSIISFNRHVAWRKDVMRRMNVSHGTSALDVCTGTGDWAISLAKSVGDSGEVNGLDFIENMLNVAHEKRQKHDFKQWQIIHINA